MNAWTPALQEPVASSGRPLPLADTTAAPPRGICKPAPGFQDASQFRGQSVSTRLRRALGHLGRGNPLTLAETFGNPGRYRQAVEHLEAALRLADGAGRDEKAGLANFEVRGLRPVSRGDLAAFAGRDRTVFDDYLEKVLLPRIEAIRPETIGFSLTFLSQAFSTVRFARKIRERHPGTRLILGGPMAACWRDADWGRPPLDLFDAVFSTLPPRPGGGRSSEGSARHRALPTPFPGGRVFPFAPPPGQAFFPDLQDLPKQPFFSPQTVLPMAFGLGCSWGRCTFCPDHRSGGPPAAEPEGWLGVMGEWLAARGPLAVHLTDSCVDPRRLDRLAQAVSERRWPVRWYAFVRFTSQLAEPGRLESWARGGCALLQFGLESASEELLRKMNKGISLRLAAEILRRSAATGIRNYVYLLFGFPGETEAHQQETLDFVLRHQDSLHYLNNAILNLPRYSPIALSPERFGIEALTRFPGEDGDLSLYTDFRDSLGSARQRARRFLQDTFLADPVVRSRVKSIPPIFTSNHAIFAGWQADGPG